MVVAESHELTARSPSLLKRISNGLPSYWKDFREDPRWILMFCLARIVAVRNALWADAREGSDAGAQSSLFALDPARVAAEIRETGICVGLELPTAVVAEIRTFAETTPCFGNHDRSADQLPAVHVRASNPARPVTSGHYFERFADCPAILRVQRDPFLAAVARSYLGAGSRLIATRLWWSFPLPAGAAANAGPPPREMMHFDLDDWRMLKFFFYLTPVDEGAGPHRFVKGSHRRHTLRHQLSLTVGRPLDEVLSAYGAENFLSIYGREGSGFVEDPFGFHAGALATDDQRLMLEIAFGVSKPNRRRFLGERAGVSDGPGRAPADVVAGMV